MKKFINSAMHCARKSIAITRQFWVLSLISTTLLFSCTKDDLETSKDVNAQSLSNQAIIAETGVLAQYNGLSEQTAWELQQARAASARYLKLDNAKKDGYIDINVIKPNMGYHFLKPSLVDGNFDPRQPEILVYNKDMAGNYYLVAVEYAVPLNLPEPSGFTGNNDQWTGDTFFELWLLHAWVWSYNPSGVFNPTNPLVHLH